MWLLITTLGSFNVQWNYFTHAYHSNHDLKDRYVAITFDDGPHEKYTPMVLDILKKYNAKATFFCIGVNAEKYPQIIKEVAEQGHVIGNHSYSHVNSFGFFNSEKVSNELRKTNNIMFDIINKKLLLFRPPFGVTNPAIVKAISMSEFKVIGWNKRSLDTVIKNEIHIEKRITKNLKSGDIILLHDTSAKTVHVLEQLLLFLQKNDFKTLTVDNMLNISAYA